MAIATAKTGTCLKAFINDEYPGIVTGGNIPDVGDIVRREGLGGVEVIGPGFFNPRGSLNFIPTTNAMAWMEDGAGSIIQRAATGYPCSALTAFTAQFEGETNVRATGCYAAGLTLESAFGDPLSATLDFMVTAIDDTAVTAIASPDALGEHWEWYHGIVSVEAVDYAIQGFTVGIEHNLIAASDLSGSKAGAGIRAPLRYIVGKETVRATVRTANPIPSSVRGNLADTITDTITLVGTFTSTAAGTLVITADNLVNTGGGVPLENSEGLVTYTYTFEARANSSALTIAYTAPA